MSGPGSSVERGIVLFRQGRHDLAESEFRRALSEDPDDPLAHAFLALSLSNRDKDTEALAEADESIRLAPGRDFSHFVRGRVLLGLGRWDEAAASAREAMELDPEDADYRVLMGQAALGKRKWADALLNADDALALDAEHAGARNLRAMALTQMGRKAEAAATLGEALAEDPEDAFTHANQGWVCLHRGDHARALDHFREALRLQPDLEWARAGIVEALKARHLIYRLMLAFFLWMGRQGRVAQILIVLGLVFGRRALDQLGRANPGLQWVIRPILVLSFAFLILTWIASPLFNFFLRFNRFGRLALSRAQTVESSWVGGCAFLAMACLAVWIATDSPLAFVALATFGLLLFPLTLTFQSPPGNVRRLLALGTAGLACLTLPIYVGVLLGAASPLGSPETAVRFFGYFVVGAIASTWLPMLTRVGAGRMG